MGDDRELSLMVQAAADGRIDFEAADFRDRRWWIRTRWQLDRMEDENVLKVVNLQHEQNLAVLSGGAVEQTFEHHWKSANENVTSVYELYFPWLINEKEKRRTSEAEKLRQMWIDAYGDPKDPKVKAKLEDAARLMRAKRAKSSERNFSDSKKMARILRQANKDRKKRGK